MIINPKMGPLTPLLAVGGFVALVALYMRPKKKSRSFTRYGVRVTACTHFVVRDFNIEGAQAIINGFRVAEETIVWAPENAELLLSAALMTMFPECRFPNKAIRWTENNMTIGWDAMVLALATNISKGFAPHREAGAPGPDVQPFILGV